MKAVKGFACFIITMLVLSMTISAYAANYTFSNSLSIRIAITMTYVDADSGVLTTKGWWHVEPGSETIVTVNADESHDVYYAAYNKNQYFDSNTPGNPNIRRWANPRSFTYTTNDEPSDDNVWQGVFYKINERSVNIDTSESPRRR